MDHKRRSVIRALFRDNNATEVSGWMQTLKNLDGPEMPFDEMLELKSEMDKSMYANSEHTDKRNRRYKHFDLRVSSRHKGRGSTHCRCAETRVGVPASLAVSLFALCTHPTEGTKKFFLPSAAYFFLY